MPRMLGFNTVITVKYLGKVLRLNAHTFVLYIHNYHIPVYLAANFDQFAFWRIFDGITDEVGDDGIDLIPVGINFYSAVLNQCNCMRIPDQSSFLKYFLKFVEFKGSSRKSFSSLASSREMTEEAIDHPDHSFLPVNNAFTTFWLRTQSMLFLTYRLLPG